MLLFLMLNLVVFRMEMAMITLIKTWIVMSASVTVQDTSANVKCK